MTKTERSSRILMQLVSRRRLTTREAAHLCGVSVRLARADLKGLARYGIVRFVDLGRSSHWMLDAERGLGPLDRISLLVGREVTRFLEGTSLHRGIDRLQELHPPDEAFPARVRYLPEPARAYAPRDEIVDSCLDGLLGTKTLSLSYDPPTGRDQFDDVQPLTLVVYRRALYLLGRLGERVYTFAIDRIAEVVVGQRFRYPTDWDVDVWLADRFGIAAGTDESPVDVTLEFSSRVAHLVKAREWHSSQVLMDLADGKVLLHMRVKGLELARFVLEWGEHCEVLGPESLRDRVVSELENALAHYRRRS